MTGTAPVQGATGGSSRRPEPVALLNWLTQAGQSYAATLGYVALPPAIKHLAAATLACVTGPDGIPLTG